MITGAYPLALGDDRPDPRAGTAGIAEYYRFAEDNPAHSTMAVN
jgi:hypothetical protein